MEFKIGGYVKFKTFDELPDETPFNRDSVVNKFHKRNIGKLMKVVDIVNRGTQPDPLRIRVDCDEERRFALKPIRIRKFNFIEIDDNLFKI